MKESDHRPATTEDEDGIDLLAYVRVIRRRWPVILLAMVAAVGLTAFVTLRMTKIYRATTVLRIETQAPQVLGRNIEAVDEMGTGSFWSNAEYYETQYRIIESRDIALRVVRALHLNTDPDFLRVPKEAQGEFKPVTELRAAAVLQGMLTVEPVKDSRLVKIHIDSPNREQARQLADEIAEAYVEKNFDSMLQSTVKASKWLSRQLDDAQKKLAASEEAVYQYKKESGILSLSLDERQNILAAQMSAAAANLTNAVSRRIELQARKSAVTKLTAVKDPMAIPFESINSSALVQQLKQDWGRLNQEYSELSERYGQKFPRMIELKAKLGRIEADIRREVTNILESVNAELSAAKKTEAGLRASLKELQQQEMELSEKGVAYNKLARDKESNEKVYEMLMGRTQEADLFRALPVNNVHVLDAALLPEVPIKPRLYVNLALSLIIGLLFGLGAAALLEYADRTIKTQDDLDAFNVTFLGIVPSIDTATAATYHSGYGGGKDRRRRTAREKGPINFDTFVHDHPKSQVAESCRAIRTNLLFMSADKPVKKILVTSPSPQEGKTTVAVNLATVMAQSGARVLLVDTDLRRPRVHNAFGLKPKNGISTMVLGDSIFEETVFHTDMPNLDVLTCGPMPPNPSELIHTERFRQVVELLSSKYDHVIFDSPPVGVVTDAAVLSKLVDGTLLIVKSLKTTKEAVKYALGVLRDIDANILGAVLNDLNLNDRKYGRQYYHYYKKYGYYYHSDEPADDDDSPQSSTSRHNDTTPQPRV